MRMTLILAYMRTFSQRHVKGERRAGCFALPGYAGHGRKNPVGHASPDRRAPGVRRRLSRRYADCLVMVEDSNHFYLRDSIAVLPRLMGKR